ncbi:MAG: 3-phosphoserine/phosphohydroxythreonine transaminase [Rubripirellula sp.]
MNATATTERVFNFSAGPAALPVSVLQEIQDELLCYPGAGASVMELSHRGKVFVQIMEEAEASIRSLFGISDDYAVLMLQGGAALQFSMIPCNLLRDSGKSASYLLTGAWGKKAIGEAKKEGTVDTVYSAADTGFDRVPKAGDYTVKDDSAYLYYCSNETIEGVQFQSEPECPAGVPLISDASSDFLSRPLDINKYGLIYACAQKNAGPAGVTVVVIRRDLLEKGSDQLPGYLNYKNHANNGSMWNTPPTFPIYVLGKVAKWLSSDIGGLAAMEKQNHEKSNLLYQVIDKHPEFYLGHAQADCRSKMNATFNLPSSDLLEAFVSEASKHNLQNLKGHRSVGGIRASVYNAMPLEGAQALASFMDDFAAKNG